MNLKVEQRDGINVVVYAEYPTWARPASPDEVAMWTRIAELERDLVLANDAAAKGELARQTAAGMQETIRELHESGTALAKRRDELVAEIEKLQIALAFWLPCVPMDDAEIAERAGNDAYLLAGAPEIPHDTAESLGWIKLRSL